MPFFFRPFYSALKFLHKQRIYTHPLKICTTFYSKDVGPTRTLPHQDILLQSIKNSRNTENLLNVVASHKIMNASHIIQSLRSIFVLQKAGDATTSRKALLGDASFRNICISLKNNIRSIDLNETVEILKILSFIGVPLNTAIMQTILQMIRTQINDLSLQQIIFLDFILRQFKLATPLSEALIIALPIIFESQLVMKTDRENLSQVADLLQYAVRNRVAENGINFLLDCILKQQNIQVNAALSLIWSLCELKQNELLSPLLKRLIRIVTEHSGELDISELESVLTKLVLRYNTKHTYYFDTDFCDTVAEEAIKRDVGFQQALWIMQKLSKVGYSHTGLLNYISTLNHRNHMLGAQIDSWTLYNLVTGLSNADQRPIHWETLQQSILENSNYFDGKRVFDWIKFAIRLATLDIYIPEVLQRAFKDNNIDSLLKEGNYANLQNFLILYQTLSTTHSEYANMLPDKTYLHKAMKSVYISPVNETYRPLKTALERGFGGSKYLLSNVTTKYGHLLHHLVVLRKGGFPISYSGNELVMPIAFEELHIPRDSHVISIFGCDYSYYKSNSMLFKSVYPLLFKSVEALRCSVIPISLDNWNSLAEIERIPYVMHKIREIANDFEQISIVNT